MGDKYKAYRARRVEKLKELDELRIYVISLENQIRELNQLLNNATATEEYLRARIRELEKRR
jgi:chromosome segregation ATPase